MSKLEIILDQLEWNIFESIFPENTLENISIAIKRKYYFAKTEKYLKAISMNSYLMFLLDPSSNVCNVLQHLLDLLRVFGLVTDRQSRHFQHDTISLVPTNKNTGIQTAADQSEHSTQLFFIIWKYEMVCTDG